METTRYYSSQQGSTSRHNPCQVYYTTLGTNMVEKRAPGQNMARALDYFEFISVLCRCWSREPALQKISASKNTKSVIMDFRDHDNK